MKKHSQIFRRFLLNEVGNIGISFGLLMIPISLAAGAAIDYGRKVDAKQSLTVAMDAAVLAGTQYLFENDNQLPGALKAAEDYFNAIIPAGKFKTLDIKFKLNKNKNGIAAYGNADIPTSLLQAIGLETLEILSDKIDEAASAEATAPETSVEVSLMLDVTSSMCDDGEGPCQTGKKITALKQAAATLIDDVVWDDQSKVTSRVALVPFSTRVRVAADGKGGGIMRSLTNLDDKWDGSMKSCLNSSGGGGGTFSAETGTTGATPWVCNSWGSYVAKDWKIMPCVTDRYYDPVAKFDTTDGAPQSGSWMNAHDGSRRPVGPDSSSTLLSSETGTSADPASHWNYNADGKCYDVAESNEIMPLTDNKKKLQARIANLEAYGATGGALGTAFSWYMISPEWSSIWGGDSEPKGYDLLKEIGPGGGVKLRKIAIMMTDGSYNTMRSWKGQPVDKVSDAAAEMCKNMKDKGIEIFTVGFELASLPMAERPIAEATLSSCATSPAHFYDSADPVALKQAFKAIGDQVTGQMTRLTK
jgi:Flp pilus assembly protein TadG